MALEDHSFGKLDSRYKCPQRGSESSIQCAGMNCHYLERDTAEEEAIYWQENAREAYAWAFQSLEIRPAALHYQSIARESSARARQLLNLPT